MDTEYEKLLKRAMEAVPKDSKGIKRFEVPVAVSEIQGSKTIIRNFGELLSAFRRDAKHLSKFLFKQLATPGDVQGSVLILQRKVPQRMIQEKLEAYAKEYIYCKECGKPDTKLTKEDRVSFIRCEACGAKFPVRNA
jgi:translation initiation factor 2 subunit 2